MGKKKSAGERSQGGGDAKGATAMDVDSAAPVDVEALFGTLQKQLRADNAKRALAAADAVLAAAPADADALRVRAALLVQLARFEEAAEACASLGAGEGDEQLTALRAYPLYRLGRTAEALSLLDTAGCTDEATMQLRAQVLYKLGRYDACVEAYGALVRAHSKACVGNTELAANIVAAHAAAGRPSDEAQRAVSGLKVQPKQSFEVAFNVATAQLSSGEDPAAAEQLLLFAQRFGKETLFEEDLAEEEVDEELLPITTQLGYVRLLLGDREGAAELLDEAIRKHGQTGDLSSAVVAVNNLACARAGAKEHLAESLKRMERFYTSAATCSSSSSSSSSSMLAGSLETQLSEPQKRSLLLSRGSLLVQANKLEAAKALATALSAAFPDAAEAALLLSAVLVREKRLPRAEEVLASWAAKHAGMAGHEDEPAVAVRLMRAQVALAAGDAPRAAALLTDLGQPLPLGAVATVAALREAGGDSAGAEAALEAALRERPTSAPEAAVLLTAAAAAKTRRGEHAAAAATFAQLAQSAGASEDARTTAKVGLVRAALAGGDAAAAAQRAEELPSANAAAALDADELEHRPELRPTRLAKKRKAGNQGEGEEAAEDEEAEGAQGSAKARKARKKRKTRFPKNFDPENPGPPPDPERWLPKRERSAAKAKAKGKKKAAENMRGAQGSVLTGADVTASASAPSAAAPPPPITAPPRAAGGKKKKGRR
mmetsp:Transcript_5842/g.19878  ORF Transcript_5842/g.19878 Transcript_5842/m.19878 type:complete len:717 (-) Transcript_5842:80-2230(-)